MISMAHTFLTHDIIYSWHILPPYFFITLLSRYFGLHLKEPNVWPALPPIVTIVPLRIIPCDSVAEKFPCQKINQFGNKISPFFYRWSAKTQNRNTKWLTESGSAFCNWSKHFQKMIIHLFLFQVIFFEFVFLLYMILDTASADAEKFDMLQFRRIALYLFAEKVVGWRK